MTYINNELDEVFRGVPYHERRELTNEEIIREVQRFYLKKTRKAFKEHSDYKECNNIYHEERNTDDYDFYTSKVTSFWFDHLEKLFDFYMSVGDELLNQVTYRKNLEELREAYANYYELVIDVTNECTLFKTVYAPKELPRREILYDEPSYRFDLSYEEATSFGIDPEKDLQFLIKHSKRYCNLLCRIYRDNVTEKLYKR